MADTKLYVCISSGFAWWVCLSFDTFLYHFTSISLTLHCSNMSKDSEVCLPLSRMIILSEEEVSSHDHSLPENLSGI